MPFVFMMATFLYLKKLKQENYFPVFGLGYLAFVYPTTLFPINVAMEGVMTFFVLSVAEMFDRNIQRKNIVRILGAMFLLFSYEASIGLLGILAIISFLTSSSGKYRLASLCFYIFFVLLKLALNIKTIQNVLNTYVMVDIKSAFESSLDIGNSKFTLSSFLVFILFPVSFVRRRFYRPVAIISALLIMFSFLYYYYFQDIEASSFFNDGASFRSLVTPMAGIFYLFIFLSFYFKT